MGDKIIEEVKTQLAETAEEVKTAVEAQGAKVDDLSGEVKTAVEAVAGATEKVTEMETSVTEVKEQVTEIETRLKRHDLSGEQSRKSLGDLVVESDNYKGMIEAGRKSMDFVTVEEKVLSSAPGSAGALTEPTLLTEIVGASPERAVRLRDLFSGGTTTDNAIEYPEETGFANLYALLTAIAASGQKEVVLDSVAGIYEGQEVTVNGEEHVVDSIVEATLTVTLVSNLAGAAPVDSELTSDTFSCTAETKIKPQANITFARRNAPVCTIPHWIPVTRQIIADASALRGYIDNRMVYGVRLAEEKQILYGNGGADELQGILTHPDIQSYLWSDGKVGDRKLDALRRAITFAQLAEYPVDGVAMNPTDFEDIELSKDDEGRYTYITMPGAGNSVWQVPVIQTTAIKPGDALLGAFGLGAAVWTRESVNIRVADQHEDYFVKNMSVILAEERLALTIYRPEAFVHVTFDNAPPSP